MGLKSGYFHAIRTDKTSTFEGGLQINGDFTFGDASADTFTCTGAAEFDYTVALGDATTVATDKKIILRAATQYINSSAASTLDIVGPTTNVTASTLGAIYSPDIRLGYDAGAYMKTAVTDATGVTAVTFAGSGATYTVTVPTFTVVAASGIKLDGTVTLDDDGTIADAANVTTITQDTITLVGATALTLDGDTSVNAAHTFTTGTGNVTIKGDMSIDADKDFDMSGGTGTFATGTGAVSLNGDVTVASGKVLYIRDASQSIASGSDDLMTITSPTITMAGATKINLDGPTTITGTVLLDSSETTGLSLTGTYTNGIDLTGATLTGGLDNALFSIGSLSAAKTFTTSEEVIPFQVIISSGTDGGSAGDSLIGGYFQSTNTADFTNRRLQGVMGKSVMNFDTFDSYGVQGTVEVADGASATGSAVNGNIAGISGKVSIAGTTANGIISGGLFTIDGAGSASVSSNGIWIEAGGATSAITNGILLSGHIDTGINVGACDTYSILLPDDAPMLIGTTRTDASTYIGMEFDETTTGVGLFTMGTTSAPMVLNTNPGANVIGHTINILHSAGAGDNENLYGSYVKAAITGAGDTDTVLVGSAPRAYIGTNGGTTVASAAYGCQPWAKHEGTGAVTAMSGVSALVDVNTDNFTATTVNAGHFHIEGAATVTGQFDGVMIEAYPDVTSLDSMLAIAVDGGATVTNAIRCTGDYTSLLNFAAANTAVVVAGTEASGNGAKIAIMIGSTPYYINAHPTSNN